MKRVLCLLAVTALVLGGCTPAPESDDPVTSHPSAQTTGLSTTTTTLPPTTTTTQTPPVQADLPVAMDLLGISYGQLWELTDGKLQVVQARGHTDVALALKSDSLPYMEILNADSAFCDWTEGVALIGKACPEEALRPEQIVTDVYLTAGGRVTSTLTVGQPVADWANDIPNLPAMTILYDFSGGMNRQFYGSIKTTVNGANALLWIDLDTSEAKAALAEKGITLGTTQEVYNDPCLGKTVSLPHLPVAGVDVWLDDKG